MALSKKTKLIAIIIAAVIVVATAITLPIVLTRDKSPVQLAIPANVAANTETKQMTWSAVDNASGYMVSVDGTEIPMQTETSYSLGSLAAGTYELKVKAVGDGKKYSDSPWSGAESYTVTAVSNKTSIAKPALTETAFTYSGSAFTVTLNTENAAYTLGGDTSKTSAGDYTATVTLNDTVNYQWSDGTTQPLSLAWTIDKAQLSFDGHSLTASDIGKTTVELSISPATVAGAVQYRLGTGAWQFSNEFTGLAADTEYTFYAKLTGDTNYLDSELISVTISTLDEAAVIRKVEFDTNEGGNIAPYNNVLSGATINAPTPPTKTAYTFGGWFKDDITFLSVWNFETDTVTEDITLYAKWTATPIAWNPTLTLTNAVYSDSYSAACGGASVATGGAITYSSQDLPEGLTLNASTGAISGNVTAGANVTPYTFTITAACAENGETLDKTFSLKVNKKSVAIPSLSNNTFNYTGSDHSVTFTPQSALYRWYTNGQNHATTARNAGSYTAYVTLANITNHQWTDGSTTPKALTWTISQAIPSALTPPTATAITYGAALSTSALNGGSAGGNWAWASGSVIPNVANSGYQVVFTPNDTANYDWSGITLTFTVGLTVNKASQSAPAAPTMASNTQTSITLNTITGAQYRVSTGTWQSSPAFTSLNPNTSYTFYVRLAETANHTASPESVSAVFSTLPAAPATYTVQFNSNNGSSVSDYENIVTGTTISAPTPPTRTAYTFGGWFKDDITFNQPWNFASDTVTANITLHAKWTSTPLTWNPTQSLSAATYGDPYSVGAAVTGGASVSTGGTISYSSLDLPAGLTLHSTNGSISGNITANASATPYQFTITASCTESSVTIQKVFTLTVNKKVVTEPSLTQSTFVYDGTAKTVTLNLSNAAYNFTGTRTQTEVGNYNAYVGLINSNYEWATFEYATITLPWSITAPVTVPGIPQNFTATPGDKQVVLTWTAPASNGGAAITTYWVSRDSTGVSWVNAGNVLTYNFTSLTNGQTYTFRVRATNSVGTGAYAEITATPVAPATAPTAPQNFTATAGNAQVALSWSAPSSDGGAAITKYEVSSNNGTDWTTASSNTAHTFTGLTNGTLYTFKVRAVNSVGNGAEASATATPVVPVTVPSAPQNFTTTPGDAQVTLTWTAPANNGGAAITKYEVSSNNGSDWTDSSTSTEHTFTGLTNGQSYTFKVRAINSAGNGAEASATATPEEEQGMFTTGTNTNTVGGIMITGLTPAYQNTQHLVIPQFIGEDEVLGIANGAFANNTNLLTVVFETGANFKFIGFETGSQPAGTYTGVFEGCTNITSMTLPFTGAWRIAFGFFGNIFGQKLATDANKIPSKLKTVTITEGSKANWASEIIYINSGAFENCADITTINVADTILEIKANAFKGCSLLSSLTLPVNGLLTLYGSAFEGCTALTSLTIPASVTTILGGFSGGVTTLTVNAGNAKYAAANNYIYEKATSHILAHGCKGSVLSGTPITIIGANAFSNVTSLTNGNILVGSSVETIRNQAFQNCTALTDLIIPNTVTRIEHVGTPYGILYGCDSLVNLTVPFITSMYNQTAVNYLRGLFIGNGSNAGVVAASLRTVTVTGSTALGNYVFLNWSNLTQITIANTVPSIGTSIFEGCSSLTSITLPHRAGGTLASGYFNGTVPASLNSVTFNAGTQLTAYMFQNLVNLQTVVLPEGITDIWREAFSGCTGLASVNIPSTVTLIDVEAFKDCTSLPSSLVFNPGGNLNIGLRAFQGCTSLINVDVSKVKTIDYGAFYLCSNLNRIEISFIGRGLGYSGLFGDIFDPYANQNLIPNRNSVCVPQSLRTVVFWGDDLTGITNPVEGAFQNCSRINTIILRGAVTQIDAQTFAGCTSLTTVAIPVSVVNIFNLAFLNASALTDVYYGGTSAQWGAVYISTAGSGNNSLTSAIKHYSGQWSYDPITGLPIPN